MKDYSLYENVKLVWQGFPVIVHQPGRTNGFPSHWHEQMEFLYCVEGNGIIKCESTLFEMQPGDLVIINSNQLHRGYCTEGGYMSYYCLIIDPSLLKGSFDWNFEDKYIDPIVQNLIIFENRISGSPIIAECIEGIANEFMHRELGYELAIKSHIFRLLVLLLRRHVQKVMTRNEYTTRARNLEKLNSVLEHIEKNYMEDIEVSQLAHIACLSPDYFSHLFKKLTGRSVNEYINGFRVDKAETLLRNTGMNITEIAMATGFNDANYFSRAFRKYKKCSPTSLRNTFKGDMP